MNALLYSANTNTQELDAGENINFGMPVRRFGKNINMSGGNVTLNGQGYYPIDANVTFTASEAGLATLQLYENGFPITGARATVTTATSALYSLHVPAVAKIKCCEEKIISASLSQDASVTNAGIVVEKA